MGLDVLSIVDKLVRTSTETVCCLEIRSRRPYWTLIGHISVFLAESVEFYTQRSFACVWMIADQCVIDGL